MKAGEIPGETTYLHGSRVEDRSRPDDKDVDSITLVELKLDTRQ